MSVVLEYPGLLLLVSVLVLSIASRDGNRLSRLHGGLEADVREDFCTILAATLTVLVRLIGFCFSMVISRYEPRKNCYLLRVIAFAVASAVFLIADIESPRGGVIRVHAENLDQLAAS